MAVNMMEILKLINEKVNIIAGKVSELDKKMDQQQITIDNLEQQVKKNNTLLFGNDETDIFLQNNSTKESNLVKKKKEADMVDDSEEIGNTEIKQLQNPLTISLNRMCQTDAFCECDNKVNDDKITQDIVLVSITNELREIKDVLQDFGATMKTMTLDKDNVVQMSPTCSNTDQISKLREELKRYRDEIKDFINKSGATNKVSGDDVSTDKKEVEKEEEIVQISPTYFSAAQLSKINEELKRIAKMYRSTNTIPIIEVLPGGQEHPFTKQLRNGIKYKTKLSGQHHVIKIKLGVDGYKSSEVQEMVSEYPDLTFTEVVKELLKSRNRTGGGLSYYDFSQPLPYDL